MFEDHKSKIYYQDQTDWDYQMYGILNAELNKLFQIGIEYHFASDEKSHDIGICQKADMEISSIEYEKLTEKTKCIMVAILNQQRQLKIFVEKYDNLKPLLNQKPLTDTLYLSQNPLNIFTAYREMNIEY